MMRSGPVAAILALVALAALAGCVRRGPPAPVSYSGNEAKKPPPALVPQGHRPHPDRIVVAQGDTLYTISQRYDVPLRSIIDANHVDPPFQLEPGTTIELPQERFHLVQPGETLYRIARIYSVDLSSLASLNHLSAPYTVRGGQTLYLPAPVEPPVAENELPRGGIAAETKPGATLPGGVTAPPVTANTPPSPPAASAKLGPGEAPAPTRNTAAAPMPVAPEALPAGRNGFAWPIQGQIIEAYGDGPNGTHNDGINIAAKPGEPVRAADSGTVAYAGNELRGYGNLVLIKHAGGYMTAYAHNAQLLVKRGDAVRRGQEIAKAGATGTVNSAQLHFEIRQGTRALDPMTLLPHLETSAR